MEQTKLNFMKQIIYAVSKPNKYFRLTKISVGNLIGFVFLFTLIISFLNILPDTVSLFGANGIFQTIHRNLPEFELKNGELYVDGRYESSADDTYVLIDTDIEQFYDKDIDKSYRQVILVSRTNCFDYQNGRIQEFNFNSFKGLNFSNTNLLSLLPFFYLIIIIIFVFYYLFFVGAYFFTALLYSLLGLFISSVNNVNLTYATIFKTAVYSKVTIRILYCFINLVNLSIPGYLRTMIAIVVTCIYVIYGILSHKSVDAYAEAGF